MALNFKKLSNYQWLFALIFSIIVFSIDSVRYCTQQKQILNGEFKFNSLKYRPTIELADSLGFESLNFIIDTTWLNIKNLDNHQNQKESTDFIFLRHAIKINPRIVNTSKESPAFVFLYAINDYDTYDNILFESVLQFKPYVNPIFEYSEKILYLQPGDTAYIFDNEMEWRLSQMSNSEYTIHFIIVYSNEADNYYYSYYIIKIKVPKEVKIPIALVDRFLASKNNFIEMSPENILITEINFDSKPFSIEECKKIDESYNVAKLFNDYKNRSSVQQNRMK